MKNIQKKYKNRKFYFKQKEQQQKNKNEESDDENQQLLTTDDESYKISLQEQLQSSDESIKELGFINVINISLATNIECLKSLVNEGVLNVIVRGFNDPSPNMINHSINACINLLNIELYQRQKGFEFSISNYLIEQGLLATIEKMLIKLLDILTQQTTVGKQKQESSKILMSNFYLLSTFTEVLQEKQLKLLTETQIGISFIGLGIKVIEQNRNQIQQQQQQQLNKEEIDLIQENNISVLNFLQVLSECSGVQLSQQLLQDEQFLQVIFGITENNTTDQQSMLALSILINLVFQSLYQQNESVLQNEKVKILLEKIYNYLEQGIQKYLSIELHDELTNLKSLIVSQCQEQQQLQKQNSEKQKSQNQQQQQQQQQDEENMNDDGEPEIELKFDQDLSNSDVNGQQQQKGEKTHRKIVQKLPKTSKNALKIWIDTSELIMTLITTLMGLFENQSFDDEEGEEEFFEDEEEEMKNDKQGKEKIVSVSSQSIDDIIKKEMVTKLFQKGVIHHLLEKTQSLKVENLQFYTKVQEEVIQEIQRIENYSMYCLGNFVESYFEMFSQDEQSLKQFWNEKVLLCIWNNLIERCVNFEADKDNSTEQKEDIKNVQLQQILDNTKLVLQIIQKGTEKNKGFSMNLPTNQFLNLFQWYTRQAQLFGSNNNFSEIMLVLMDISGIRFHPTNPGNNAEENEFMTKILIDMVQSAKNPIVSAQALNTLYDVQSEELYDQIFVKLNLMPILQGGVQLFKQQLPGFKKTYSKKQYSFLNQTYVNLKRFIEYKQQHIK